VLAGGDQVGRLLPAHEFEHHHAAENRRAGVDPIEAGVLGGTDVTPTAFLTVQAVA